MLLEYCLIKATIAATKGGNPIPTKSGAATAAGVPNPAAPSKKIIRKPISIT